MNKEPASPYPSIASLTDTEVTDSNKLAENGTVVANSIKTSPDGTGLIEPAKLQKENEKTDIFLIEKHPEKLVDKPAEISSEKSAEDSTPDMDRIPEEESEESDDEEDVRELEGKIYSAKGQEVK